MASLQQLKGKDRRPNGRWRVLFYDDGQRQAIRLGKISKRQAETAARHVEVLLSRKVTGEALPAETSVWLSEISVVLFDKLVAAELAEPRKASTDISLGELIDQYFEHRKSVKESSRIVWRNAKRNLIEFFSSSRSLGSITPGDADEWHEWLIESGLGENTIRKRCGVAKQFFKYAIRKNLISENPFQDLKSSVGANEERQHFVERSVIDQVIEVCDDIEWKLIIALARYGGLRCPSEHLQLTWGDVNWEKSVVIVHSPKTAHHSGRGRRQVPLFPEIRPFLESAFAEAGAACPSGVPPSKSHIITRYRDAGVNLRTQFLKLIDRAGQQPWPRLFQNLRASRETELVNQYPIHVACKWIGNSKAIAMKHYTMVTDEHFQQAIGEALNEARHPPTNANNGSQEVNSELPQCEVLY